MVSREGDIDAGEWNRIIASIPASHILQTWEWGQFKQLTGWNPIYKIWRDSAGEVEAAALVLKREISIRGVNSGLSVLYVPRGPIFDWRNRSLSNIIILDLKQLCREQRSIFIKIDPEIVTGTGVPGEQGFRDDADGLAFIDGLKIHGWTFSEDQVQFRNTMLLDLGLDEDALLSAMKQKSRYNLRIAQKKGVEVYPCGADELSILYRMYAETSTRDGFVIRPENYYVKLWGEFMAKNMAQPFIAKVDGEAVAGLVLFYFGGRAWYLHGMSRPVHREKMPNYLLHWEAIRFAKAKGCKIYDMWGAPDHFDEADSMWKVYRFKEGLGAAASLTIGAWDYAPNPLIYSLYTNIMPRVLNIMRGRGKKRVQNDLN